MFRLIRAVFSWYSLYFLVLAVLLIGTSWKVWLPCILWFIAASFVKFK